jgi:hypothetical protein
MYVHNDHLWGWTKAAPGILRFSSMKDVEYWADVEQDAATVGTTSLTVGGHFLVGSSGNPITGIVSEGGAFANTGCVGGNLLVFTKSYARRIFGSSLANFRMEDAFGEGCLSPWSVQNCGGTIMWLSREGVMAIPAGSNSPRLVSEPLGSDILGTMEFSASGEERAYYSASAYWRNHYILSMPERANAVGTWICYLGTGGEQPRFAWTTIEDFAPCWWRIAQRPTAAIGTGAIGANDLVGCSDGGVMRFAPWLSTVYGARPHITYRKELGALFPDCASDTYLRRVDLIVQVPAETIVYNEGTPPYDGTDTTRFTVKVWAYGHNPTDLPTADPTFVTSKKIVTTVAQWNNVPRRVSIPCEVACVWPMIEISAPVSADLRIKAIHVHYSYHGETIKE